jgi:transketolase
MRVYLPSDRFQTASLIEALLLDQKPAYIRVGRNPVEDIYSQDCPFRMDHATVITDGDATHAVESSSFDWETADGNAVLLVACGEMVRPAVEAAKQLDRVAVCEAAKRSKLVVTVEEHAPFGGLGSMVSQVTAAECQTKTINLALPDAPVITGKSQAVFDYYGLNAEGINKVVKENL